MAASACSSLEKKIKEQNLTSVTKEQYSSILGQCIIPYLGKEIKELQRLYGAESLTDSQQMRQIGIEVGGIMAQACPAYLSLAAMISTSPVSMATTTGQTVGQLGTLRGTSIAMLQLAVNETEKAEFLWLSKFKGAEELLPKLTTLQGQKARINWQEIEIYQPEKKQYTKLREIIGIDLL